MFKKKNLFWEQSFYSSLYKESFMWSSINCKKKVYFSVDLAPKKCIITDLIIVYSDISEM